MEKTMTHFEHPLARRTLIKGAGLGLIAGTLAEVQPAQSAGVAEGNDIWSGEYWAKKGDVPLWMYRKRVGAPKAGEPARPVVLFVHGSSVTSRVFDLTVPGKGEYSAMNEFARYGFDCWTIDHENYGKSGRTSGNADIASGVEDLKAAVEGSIGWCSPPSPTRARARRPSPSAPSKSTITARTTCASATAT